MVEVAAATETCRLRGWVSGAWGIPRLRL